MFYEIDVLDLGNADAKIISLNDNGARQTIVIDGGNPGDGEKVVQHLNKYHRVDHIDLVICTHPDKDHIGGLPEIISSIKTNRVWIHDPLQHIEPLFFRLLLAGAKAQNKAQKIVESFEATLNFISIVDRLGIPRVEPFDGLEYGPLIVVGPTVEYYSGLISGFRNIDALVADELKDYNPLQDLLESLTEENNTNCVLDEKNDTSNENNSSVIILGIIDEKKFLFTGDAGVQALTSASERYHLDNIHWLDVPHHGSKHNLSTTLLDYFRPQVSSISADGSRKHPSRAVINALKKYGNVYSTHKSGNMAWYNWKNPNRTDYNPSEPL